MNVLIACEESQRVCTEFRKKGHRAFSCDIQESSGGHSEWHIKSDVIPLLNGNCEFQLENGNTEKQHGKWDLIIAHPPCTDLTVSGARHFEKKRQNGSQRKSIEFFCQFLNCDCDKLAIENPIGIISGLYVLDYFPDLCEKYNIPQRPSQIIQPWMFGDNYSKSTCLWLKGLPNLIPEVTEKPEIEYYVWVDKYGRVKRQDKFYTDALKLPPEERAKVRSKTFPGIARAMAEQWG